MNFFSGFKGFIFNLLLIGLFFLISFLVEKVNLVKDDFKIPLNVLLIIVPFLILEFKANECILSHEFQKMTEAQSLIWTKMSKTSFFGILLLMMLIWRTYFKMELLILPLWNKIYNTFGLTYNTLVWTGKIPVYLSGIIVFSGECLLLKNTLFPEKLTSPMRKVWFYRIVILISVSFYITGLVQIFSKEFYPLNMNSFLLHFPFLTIIFIFFYIPLRWVEIISDVMDCKNYSQLLLFWLSTFFGMVIMFV